MVLLIIIRYLTIYIIANNSKTVFYNSNDIYEVASGIVVVVVKITYCYDA